MSLLCHNIITTVTVTVVTMSRVRWGLLSYIKAVNCKKKIRSVSSVTRCWAAESESLIGYQVRTGRPRVSSRTVLTTKMVGFNSSLTSEPHRLYISLPSRGQTFSPRRPCPPPQTPPHPHNAKLRPTRTYPRAGEPCREQRKATMSCFLSNVAEDTPVFSTIRNAGRDERRRDLSVLVRAGPADITDTAPLPRAGP